VRALSIKEPWASLIWEGKKSVETRTWKTSYRGVVLLCASKSPNGGLAGNAFAVATLVDVKPMVKEHEVLACCEVYPGAYSWFFKDVRVIAPFPVKGSLGLFEVDYDG
jgi:hypothetical protein